MRALEEFIIGVVASLTFGMVLGAGTVGWIELMDWMF